MKANEKKYALCKRRFTKYKPIQNDRHRDEGGSVEGYGLRDHSAFEMVDLISGVVRR
jgi:hypothetical protein